MDAACSLCRPECFPENYEVLSFYNYVEGQYRYTGGMTSFKTGLDIQAVQTAFDILEIPKEDRQELFAEVMFFSSRIARIENKMIQDKIEKEKKKNAR